MIQNKMGPACTPCEKRMPNRGNMQKIPVSASLRAKPGVKLVVNFNHMTNCHRLRKARIHAAHPGAIGPHCIRIEVDHLPECVNPGVCSPRADGRHPMAGNFAERPLEMVLDSAAGRLGLPAIKGAAVVG